ncbi:MAG: ubiquinol-cytochrome c reductase iron-sulfur subunit [Leptolyngbyaceae cyanobacterium CSU_1_4]|nr:ubiquinol-cytochrome c reductase iron-sulfur subunit [Leptolyngbyaceae cyanobacterium CSU_1_4]
MKRREFVSWVGVSGVITALPATVTACGQQTSTSQAPAAPIALRTDGFEVTGTVAELEQKGQLLNEKMLLGKALVVRETENQFIAVDPTCNHAGCNVEWNADQAFVCPCHDSKFANDGKLLQGPATESLALYTVKIEGDQVLVKKG